MFYLPQPTEQDCSTAVLQYCILIVEDMNTYIQTYTEDIIFLTLQVSESCMRHSQQLQGNQTVEQSFWDLSDFVSVQDPADTHRCNVKERNYFIIFFLRLNAVFVRKMGQYKSFQFSNLYAAYRNAKKFIVMTIKLKNITKNHKSSPYDF